MKGTLQIFIKIIKLTICHEGQPVPSQWILRTMMNIIGTLFLKGSNKKEELFLHNLQLFHRLLKCHITSERALTEEQILKIYISALNLSAKIIFTTTHDYDLAFYRSIVQGWMEQLQPEGADFSYLWQNFNIENEFSDLHLLGFDCGVLCNENAIKDLTIAIAAYDEKNIEPDTIDPDHQYVINTIFENFKAITKCPLSDEDRASLLEEAEQLELLQDAAYLPLAQSPTQDGSSDNVTTATPIFSSLKLRT